MVLIVALYYQKKKVLVLISLKQTQNFVLSLHYNADNSYLFVNRKEMLKFKRDNKSVNVPAQFCQGNISNGFSAADSREVSLHGNAHDFSVDDSSIDESDILKTHKY